jgi:hypothetical protein
MVVAKLPQVAGSPTLLALTLRVIFFSIYEGANPSTMSSSWFPAPEVADPPQCPVPHILQPAGQPGCSLHELQYESLPDSLVEYRLPRCNCSLRPRFLVPFLNSGFGLCLLPSIHPFGAPHTILSLPCPWQCPSCPATPAQCVILWAAANFFQLPTLPGARSISFTWCPAASRQPYAPYLALCQFSLWHLP